MAAATPPWTIWGGSNSMPRRGGGVGVGGALVAVGEGGVVGVAVGAGGLAPPALGQALRTKAPGAGSRRPGRRAVGEDISSMIPRRLACRQARVRRPATNR